MKFSENKTFRSHANSFQKNRVKRERDKKKNLRPEDLLDHHHGGLGTHGSHVRFSTQSGQRRDFVSKKLKNTL